MADNFNLRTFLIENKLTKNAQLLSEEQEDYRYFDEEGNGGFYLDTVDGHKIYSMEDSSVMDTCFYAIEDPNGDVEFVAIDVAGEPISSEQLQNEYELLSYVADFIETDIANELGQEGGEESLDEASDYGFDALMDAADDLYPEGTPENGKLVFAIEKALHANKIDTSEFGHDPSAASRAVQAIAGEIVLNETTNKMTAKERKLVKMVQEAMGMGEENVDYTMGHHNDPNQLPNPAPELNIPEGDEMADETVIPEYRTIDELMKSIDHGTNKVAEEHKIQEMKKIAQMLREKARKMEESEHAAHISPKDLKQLATDAAKLEKAAEKLKAAFDKKFNKKEKSASAPKAEKVEALQENKNTMENFDLRKFLVENKLTTSSRMLKEEQQPVETLTFGYDLENTQKVQDYLVANYKTSSNQPDILGKEDDANPDCEIIFEYGGDTVGAVDVFNPAILQDRKFMSLVNACEGKGHFEEGDEEYDDEY